MSNTDEENDTQAAQAAWELLAEARKERDEARQLAAWAVPLLRDLCHDHDVAGIGWEAAQKMDAYPEIFNPNDKDLARRALDSE